MLKTSEVSKNQFTVAQLAFSKRNDLLERYRLRKGPINGNKSVGLTFHSPYSWYN